MCLAELATDINDIRGIGDNKPPGPIDFARVAITDLSAFLAEHPVIASENEARQAKLFVDHTRATMGEIEDARDRQVRPLNEQIAVINAEYKAVHNTDTKRPGTLDKLLNELRARLTQYAKAEEDRRALEAAEARRIAELAEMEARLAEQREREVKDDAAHGVAGVDLGSAIIEADETFADFKKLDRAATRAERDVNVRIGGGFSGRSLGMRTTETLILDDAIVAINAIGVTDKIRDAILSAARDYRRLKGELPPGISSERTRQV